MSKHDFSLNTVTAIFDSIINNENMANDSVLSIENMAYSWNTGMVNIVVQWFEILYILGERDKMTYLMQKAESKFEDVVGQINEKDSNASESLDSVLDSVNSLNSTVLNLMTELSQYATVREDKPCCWLDKKVASIYSVSQYVTYDAATGKYTYNAEEISNIFKKKDNANADDYDALAIILSTMVDDEGNINTDALEGFLELAYTDGLPLANYKNADREGTVLKELSLLMGLKKNATACVNKEYLQKNDISDLTSEEKNQLRKVKSEIAICSIIIAATETYDATSLIPSRYKTVGKVNTTTSLGLGMYKHLYGTAVEENEDISQLAVFDIEKDKETGAYAVTLNGRKSYDVYEYSSCAYILENIYTPVAKTRNKKYGNEIKDLQTMYTADIKSIEEYTDDYVEKKITKWSKGKAEKAGEFIIKQIPVVSNVAGCIEVAYDVSKDTYEWYTGYEKEVSEANVRNAAINKMANNSKRYVENLTSDVIRSSEDLSDGKCYTATYYYDEDKLVVDDGSMIINEEAAAEYKKSKESFK